jgi:hypothetical protein
MKRNSHRSAPLPRIERVGGIFLLSILALSFCSGALAQQDQGTITGVVKDTSGAVIPRARVTLMNTDTGLILHTQTDSHGTAVGSVPWGCFRLHLRSRV